MSTTEKHRSRLITLLKELFQLDQPELDFGLYKIMHAKNVQITKFLESDLLKELEQAFGEKDSVDASQLRAQAVSKLEEALGEEALDDKGNLREDFRKIPAGKKYLAEMAAVELVKDTLSAESEIYDHLYRFFERYYDSGDFMSRRYYARESNARAAPYAVPYDGREVYLHWANKDQYYIKSSEYLSNYTFELNEAIRLEVERQKGLKDKGPGFDFSAAINDKSLKVHCRIVDASEGEHGNLQAAGDQKQFFIIYKDAPVKVENGELVIQFQYRADSEKTGQDNIWQKIRLQQAEATVLQVLKTDKSSVDFLRGLELRAPTDSKDKRTLLGKYLQKYAARNTMDYFIHKDLGGFMRRELDFYIKNEIMRLDDIENAEAPKVEQYLTRIRVLRRIAHQLISFLAQLEDFQKKLWLKKKFVTETHYCITLDRVPEKFYSEIVANESQLVEWEKLFAISEIKTDLFNTGAKPTIIPAQMRATKIEFLKTNPYLLLDTALFSDGFKQRLIAEIPDFDAQCDGVLMHSENFQALRLMDLKMENKVRCVHIDPPYNTDTSGFLYKNSYKHSSWLSMMYERINSANKLRDSRSSFLCHIDENEYESLHSIFASINHDIYLSSIIWDKKNPMMGGNGIAIQHEYIIWSSKFDGQFEANSDNAKLILKKASEIIEKFKGVNNLARAEFSEWVRDAKELSGGERANQYLEDDCRVYQSVGMSWPNPNPAPKEFFKPLIHPVTGKPCPVPARGWSRSPAKMQEVIEKKEIIFGKDEKTQPRRKIYLTLNSKRPISSIIYNGRKGKLELDKMGLEFSYCHPVSLYEEIINSTMLDKEGYVLDFFAGSGTSAHACINLKRLDPEKAYKYYLVEVGDHCTNVTIPRIKKSVYSQAWKEGKPVFREGISHCFKYLRLESYEDTLNNLVLKADSARDAALSKNADMRREYLLNYFLDVETSGSQSLLNIADFRDPTAYKMQIKKPGSEEQTLQSIDVIETFNWLIGLWVQHMGAPHCLSAEFDREKDADLPQDQNTRLICKRLKLETSGTYWFRLIEGYTLKVPGDDTSKVPTLIVWRKQTDDAEKDNAVLQKYLMEKLQISPREQTYGVIYINGSHTLPNPVVEGEQTKVKLIEEAFNNAMWVGDSV